jgi:hypothetical protein
MSDSPGVVTYNSAELVTETIYMQADNDSHTHDKVP